MALIIIGIAFYFDFKHERHSFISDLKGGIFICLIFLLSAILLKILGVHILTIIFSIGIEIIVLFSIKAYLNSRN